MGVEGLDLEARRAVRGQQLAVGVRVRVLRAVYGDVGGERERGVGLRGGGVEGGEGVRVRERVVEGLDEGLGACGIWLVICAKGEFGEAWEVGGFETCLRPRP